MNAPLQTSSLFRPATRLSSIGVSEILKITGLATDLKRQGKDVIILALQLPICFEVGALIGGLVSSTPE